MLSAGNPQTLALPDGSAAIASAINNQGEIVGGAEDQGFLATGPELLYPVPSARGRSLLSGPAVATDSVLQSIGFGDRPVKSAAADGVTEVVVRIPTQNVGDQFKLTLINDQNVQSNLPNPDWDGALGNPGDTTFSGNQITVTAIGVATQGGGTAPLAFAVYRVPIDFARQNADSSYQSGFCAFASAPPDSKSRPPGRPAASLRQQSDLNR